MFHKYGEICSPSLSGSQNLHVCETISKLLKSQQRAEYQERYNSQSWKVFHKYGEKNSLTITAFIPDWGLYSTYTRSTTNAPVSSSYKEATLERITAHQILARSQLASCEDLCSIQIVGRRRLISQPADNPRGGKSVRRQAGAAADGLLVINAVCVPCTLCEIQFGHIPYASDTGLLRVVRFLLHFGL